MSLRPRLLPLTLAAVLAAALGPAAAASSAAAGTTAPAITSHPTRHVCGTARPGHAACTAIRRLDVSGRIGRYATPAGYGPADITSAYGLGSATSSGTVAIVDAYDDPKAAADLSTYRAQYGLPPCTTSNGCFHKVSQTGSTTSLPQRNGSWAQEISLDLDMVSAACPSCTILLVEASSASFANLGTAVNYAARQPGVFAISNSYGGSDSSATAAYDHPGIAVTASTGDSGYGVQSPASFPTVVAVGGTSLTRASSTRGWAESAWSGAGSGCSTLNAKPTWQTSVTQCGKRASADVSAVADPNTGVAVYDSYAYQGSSGWMVFGGTSASSPIIASVYALGGNLAGYPAQYTWGHVSALNDVTSGSNGTCATTVWCHAGAGWDGPTGLGTPNGVTAF